MPSDMLDPMIIVGEWKLLLGKVDQCWWQGPHYPVRAATFSAVESIGSNRRPISLLREPCRRQNGSVTWDTHATWINCTTPTKKACLFNVIEVRTSCVPEAALCMEERYM